MSKKRRDKKRGAVSSRPEGKAAVPAAVPAAVRAALPAAAGPLLPGPWYLHIAAFAALLAATCLLYSGDLRLGFFHLDDTELVVNNPWIREVSAANVGRILAKPYFANYIPLPLLSYMLDYALAGPDALAFHLSSNLWAGAVAGLVYLLAVALLRDRLLALMAGALFVVHPVHVEAVAWISSRKDLLATGFALLSILAYLGYRRPGGGGRRLWYVLSLVGFTLGIAGKQSVVVLPAMLILHDLLVEKRRGLMLWLEKLPYAAAAAFFSLQTMGALPETRHGTSFFEIVRAFAQNLWLLTGFGDYVIYREPPEPAGQALMLPMLALLILCSLLGPLLLRKRVTGFAVCIFYWIVLAFLPSQILSFVHPVADRYLFFPSVPLVILIAWGAGLLVRRPGRALQAAAVAAVLVLAVFWARSTLGYLAEWRDPRSVWYAACARSTDPLVHLYLGTHYQDAADRLGSGERAGRSNDESVNALVKALGFEGEGRPLDAGTRDRLMELAWEQFELADKGRGTLNIPNLYFRRGKLELSRKHFESARKEFERAYELSQSHTYEDVRHDFAVRCHYGLGLVAWNERNYKEALRLIRMAEKEQQTFKGNWVPEVTASRERLERLLGNR